MPLNLNLPSNFLNNNFSILDGNSGLNTAANVGSTALTATILAINSEVRDLNIENLSINKQNLEINKQLLELNKQLVKAQIETHAINVELLEFLKNYNGEFLSSKE